MRVSRNPKMALVTMTLLSFGATFSAYAATTKPTFPTGCSNCSEFVKGGLKPDRDSCFACCAGDACKGAGNTVSCDNLCVANTDPPPAPAPTPTPAPTTGTE